MGNVCGSIGLLHALMNLPEEGQYALKKDSPLVQFKKASLPLDSTCILCSSGLSPANGLRPPLSTLSFSRTDHTN